MTKSKKIRFESEGDPYCCGIDILGSYGYIQYGWHDRDKAQKEFPLEEVFADLDSQVEDVLTERLDGDKPVKGSVCLLQTSIVLKSVIYGHGQVEIGKVVQEWLVSRKWTKDREFVNFNTGNTVAVYSKKHPMIRLWNKRNKDDEEDDDWDF